MSNPLSYTNKLISGKEFKDWLQYQLENHTSHYKDALRLKRYLNVSDTSKYIIYFGYDKTRCEGTTPMLLKVDQ